MKNVIRTLVLIFVISLCIKKKKNNTGGEFDYDIG